MDIAKAGDTPTATRDLDERVEDILGRMTVEEKAGMLAGVDAWHFPGVPRFGIPNVRVTDCGHGVTLAGERASQATCMPTGIGMASTWNRELMERAGRVLGRESRALGCSLLLGPMINLHRIPLNGRSYETFSEDPWLAGLLGAGVIRGIQAEGVGACVKAMAVNSQQRDQQVISSDVSERALRELYLRTFQFAIEHGDPVAVMTSYNTINGIYPSEDPWLLSQVVKGEWDYRGLVVSDWRAVHRIRALTAGLDIEMPGPGKHLHRDGVLGAMAEGLHAESQLDDTVRRLLHLLVAFGESDAAGAPAAASPGLDSAENRATALAIAIAEESIVLLKNEGGLLPLDRAATKRILVVGPNAVHARLGGGGSASVTPFYAVSPLEGIRELCGDAAQYIEGCSLVGSMAPIRAALAHHGDAGALRAGLIAEYFNGAPEGVPVRRETVPAIDFSWGWASPGTGVHREGFTVRYRGVIAPEQSGVHRIGVVAQEGVVRLTIGGRQVLDTAEDALDMRPENFEENYRTTYHVEELDLIAGEPVPLELKYTKRVVRAALRLEWETPGDPPGDALITAAREADAVIVCAGLSNLFEGGGKDRADLELPAAQSELIRVVADANPRTVVVLVNGGPVTMPWEPAVPANLEAWYPGQEGGRAIARILFGETDPSGRLPDSLVRRLEDHASAGNYPGDGSSARFAEELFIGYRHLDAAGIEPHFPFGFGRGYTTFAIDAPTARVESASLEDPRVVVQSRVTNTGIRHGSEVVQLYLRRVGAPADRPLRELRGFEKVPLAPGDSADVTFELGVRELEHWDAKTGGWDVAPGEYEVLVGRHSRSLDGAVIRLGD